MKRLTVDRTDIILLVVLLLALWAILSIQLKVIPVITVGWQQALDFATEQGVLGVCFAVNGVLTKDVPSGIYNMGDDEALSTNELIEEICKSIGKKAHIWKLPKGLMNGVAKVGGWLHLPLNPERLRKLTENYISSNEKIK